ncbi:hypothetical protein LguiA_034557 [Lonicera macranthoides]
MEILLMTYLPKEIETISFLFLYQILRWKILGGGPGLLKYATWCGDLMGSLPTKLVLKSRKVEVDSMCPIYQQVEEDSFHVLVSCHSACHVWNILVVGDRIGASSNVVEWWNSLQRQCSKQVMEVAAALMWGLWQNRNSVIWKGTVQQPTRIVNYASNFLAQWKSANSDSNFSTSYQYPSLSKWSKPPVGWIKCNVDAIVFSNPGRSGYGGHPYSFF